MIRFLINLFFGNGSNKELLDNIKKYETNRKIHRNKNN